METPWGRSDSAEECGEGLTFYTTPSHGGFRVSPELLKQMPPALRRNLDRSGAAWYEEDCEVALVVLSFPDRFSAAQVHSATITAKHVFPDEYEAWTGTVIPIEESRTKTERRFNADHANDWLAISAFGDWKEGVPKGFVLVIAAIGGRANRRGPTAAFLVPEDEYKHQAGFPSFIVDPTRHRRAEPQEGADGQRPQL